MTSIQNHTYQSFHLYACLPFVELAHQSTIRLGPILFWPASKYQEFLAKEEHESFLNYMESVRQIKARSAGQNGILVNTVKLTPEGTTCISIAEDVPLTHREYLLIDSFYLLYFACTFRNLYYGQEVPSFNAFRKMIPAEMNFISKEENWKNLYIHEAFREETVCIHLIDEDICQSFGRALNLIYLQSDPSEQQLVQTNKRLVRSIRYFVDRFIQRFINLFDKGLNLSDGIFEPEDFIFLVSSFEVLLDINDKQPAADFKNKLRSFLHLKYGGVVEIFWKWVDDFYKTKCDIVHGETIFDPTFKLNPNYEVSHMIIGIRLFIYSVCYTLFKCKWILPTHENPHSPPDFKWIHPEEILLFFWTEANLLRKLDGFMTQSLKKTDEELLQEIRQLTGIFVSLYEHFDSNEDQVEKNEGIVFIPNRSPELNVHIEHMLELCQFMENHPQNEYCMQNLHPNFIACLHSRLEFFRTCSKALN